MNRKSLGSILIILLMVIMLGQNVYAVDLRKNERMEENTQEYTELYKEYLKLSEEEKKKVNVIPSKYKVSMDVLTKEQEESGLLNFLKSRISIFSNNQEEKIPSSYVLLTEEKMKKNGIETEEYGGIDIKTENQGDKGLCWDFASLTSLESNLELQKGETYDFSENHMNYITSSDFGNPLRELDDGGNFSMFIEYSKNLYGPVLEDECTYDEIYEKEDYEDLISLEPKVYINEVMDFPTIYKNFDLVVDTYTEEDLALLRKSVKEHIMNNGSVMASVNFAIEEEGTFNDEKKAFCILDPMKYEWNYMHALSIIGWDDNYSKENFPKENRPSKDGAYIALNSWGNDTEYVYISYEDSMVECDMHGVVSASSNNLETEKVKFRDNNLYNAIKQECKKNIISYDDSKNEIQITKLALNNITELDLENKEITDINGIEKFSKLNMINLSNNNIINIEPLSNLTNLGAILLDDNNIENITALSNLRNSVIMSIRNNNIKDISSLEGLIYLGYLDISGNKEIENISYLNNLVNLTNLYLDNTSITSINDLRNLLGLNQLVLSGDNISDLSVLVELPNLMVLELDNTNITDLTVLKDTNISELSLKDNDINKLSDIRGLLELEKIEYLYVDNNNIQDLSELKQLTSLLGLSISNNNIQSIEKLGDLTSLILLDISTNHISDISELSKLSNLSYLNIGSNNIIDLNALSNLKNMSYLVISNNEVVDINPLRKMRMLGTLDLSDTKVSDISILDYFEGLYGLYIQNSCVTNVDVLKDIDIYEGNLGDIEIADIELINKLYDKNVQYKKMEIKDEKNVEKNKQTIFDLPEVFINAFYNGFYENNVEFEYENCTSNKAAYKMILEQSELGNRQASVKMTNGLNNEISYNLEYNVVDRVEIKSIGLKNEYKIKDTYMENENFKTDNLQVFVIYENGMKEFTNDYEIIDGTDLQKGQQSVIIRSTKNPNLEYEFPIYVYGKDEIKTISFEDEYLYSAMKDDFDKITGIYPMYSKADDIEKTITLLKEDINQVETMDLWLCKEYRDIRSLKGIENFTELKEIVLQCCVKLEDIESLLLLNKLEGVNLGYTKITDIEKLIKKDKIQAIHMHYVEDEIKNINQSNKVVELPKFIYDALTIQNNVKAKGIVYYETNEDDDGERYVNFDGKTSEVEVKIDSESKKAIVESDIEISEDKPKQIRGIGIEITGGKVEGIVYTAYYNMEQSSSEMSMKGDLTGNNEIDQNDYIAILRHIASINGGGKEAWKLTEEQQKQADVTGDGIINLNDVLKIKRYIAAKNDTNVADKYPKWLEL